MTPKNFRLVVKFDSAGNDTTQSTVRPYGSVAKMILPQNTVVEAIEIVISYEATEGPLAVAPVPDQIVTVDVSKVESGAWELVGTVGESIAAYINTNPGGVSAFLGAMPPANPEQP